MLPAINRLKSDKDFKNIFKSGRTLENQFLRVKFLKNHKNISRFGFIVSTKISKRANIRNTLKRRLRAIVISLIKDFKTGFDIVIWPKTASTTLDYKDLFENLYNLISTL